MRKIESIITIGLLAGVGLIAAKNWGSLTTIGSKVSSGITSGLNALAGGSIKDAGKE